MVSKLIKTRYVNISLVNEQYWQMLIYFLIKRDCFTFRIWSIDAFKLCFCFFCYYTVSAFTIIVTLCVKLGQCDLKMLSQILFLVILVNLQHFFLFSNVISA